MRTKKTGKQQYRNSWHKLWHRREKQYKILRFLIKFNIFAIPLYAILFSQIEWTWLENFTAGISYNLLHGMGIPAAQTGDFITIPIRNGQWGAFINWDCTGWKSFLALFALVMATELQLKSKAKGLAVMLPALFVVNIARISFMFYYVYNFDLAYFDTVHAAVWSWGMIAAILILWVAWMRHYAGKTGIRAKKMAGKQRR